MRQEISSRIATNDGSIASWIRRLGPFSSPQKGLLPLVLATCTVFLSSCQTPAPATPLAKPSPSAPPSKVEALDASVGRVVSVNLPLRFVVLDFSLSRLPQSGERLDLFHDGAIVGELKTGYHTRESTVVADILQGTPVPGDEVRPTRP